MKQITTVTLALTVVSVMFAQVAAASVQAQDASIYLIMAASSSEKAEVDVRLGSRFHDNLKPGQGLMIRLEPGSSHYLILEHDYLGIDQLEITAPAAGEAVYYELYLDVSNPSMLHLEELTASEGKRLQKETEIQPESIN